MNLRFWVIGLIALVVFSGGPISAQNAAIDAFRAEVVARNEAIKNSNLDFYGNVVLTGEYEATLTVKPDWMGFVTPADPQGNLLTLFNVWKRHAGSDATFVVVDVDGNVVKRYPDSEEDAQAEPTPQSAEGLEPTEEEFVFVLGDRQLAFPAGVCQALAGGFTMLQGRVGQSGVAFQFDGNRAQASFQDVIEEDGRTFLDNWQHEGEIKFTNTNGRLSINGTMEHQGRREQMSDGMNRLVQGFERPTGRAFRIEAQC